MKTQKVLPKKNNVDRQYAIRNKIKRLAIIKDCVDAVIPVHEKYTKTNKSIQPTTIISTKIEKNKNY